MDVLLRSVNVVTNCTGRLELWLVRLVDFKSNLNPWLYVLLRKENLRWIVRKFRSCRAGNIQGGEEDGENDRLVSDTHMWNKSFKNWAIQSPVPAKSQQNRSCEAKMKFNLCWTTRWQTTHHRIEAVIQSKVQKTS